MHSYSYASACHSLNLIHLIAAVSLQRAEVCIHLACISSYLNPASNSYEIYIFPLFQQKNIRTHKVYDDKVYISFESCGFFHVSHFKFEGIYICSMCVWICDFSLVFFFYQKKNASNIRTIKSRISK